MTLDLFFIIIGLLLNATIRTTKNPTLGTKSTSKQSISTKASIAKTTSTITKSKATMASSVHTTIRTTKNPTLGTKSTSKQSISTKASIAKTTSTITKSKATMASSVHNIDSKLVTTRPNQEEPEKDEYHASSVLTVGLPAGSVTLVSIVLITALILICRRRRKQKERSIPMEAMKQQTTETRNQYKANGNQTYHECEEGTLNPETAKYQGHISSEFGLLQDNTISPSGTGKLHDKVNFNTGGGTYDVTFTENNPRQVVQVNSYDHMSLKKRKERDNNNVGIQDQGNDLDNAYDKTYPEKCKSSKECEVNTYDMMNFHPQK